VYNHAVRLTVSLEELIADVIGSSRANLWLRESASAIAQLNSEAAQKPPPRETLHMLSAPNVEDLAFGL